MPSGSIPLIDSGTTVLVYRGPSDSHQQFVFPILVEIDQLDRPRNNKRWKAFCACRLPPAFAIAQPSKLRPLVTETANGNIRHPIPVDFSDRYIIPEQIFTSSESLPPPPFCLTKENHHSVSGVSFLLPWGFG